MDIPWNAQAHFNDIDGGGSFTGTLLECVRAFSKLPEERRRGALITSDEMVPVPDQPSPVSNLDHEALEWLEEKLSEEEA